MTLRDIQPDPHTFHRPIPKVSVIPPITTTPHEKWPQMSIHHKIAKSPRYFCPGKTPREAPLLLRWICLGGDRLTVVTEAEGELVMTMCRDRGKSRSMVKRWKQGMHLGKKALNG